MSGHSIPNTERGSDAEQPKENVYHTGVFWAMKETQKFPRVGIAQAIFSYHNLINHSYFVEQTIFNRIQAEKKFALSPCCPFKLVLCRSLQFQSLDEATGVFHNISRHLWIKQTNQKTSTFSHQNCVMFFQ